MPKFDLSADSRPGDPCELCGEPAVPYMSGRRMCRKCAADEYRKAAQSNAAKNTASATALKPPIRWGEPGYRGKD